MGRFSSCESMTKAAESHQLYPVEPGDVWRVGNGVYVCGDIEEGYLDILDGYLPEPIDLIYSDPPWNAGNARWWRTHAGVELGRTVDWEAFYDRILDFISGHAPQHVFLEMSVANTPWLTDRSAKYGLAHSGSEAWTCYYGAPVNVGNGEARVRRPNSLLHFGPFLPGLNPEGMRGSEMTRHVFGHAHVFGGTAIDPCIGKGMTARIAHEFGMTSCGLELSPERLAVTLHWLDRKYGDARKSDECKL